MKKHNFFAGPAILPDYEKCIERPNFSNTGISISTIASIPEFDAP